MNALAQIAGTIVRYFLYAVIGLLFVGVLAWGINKASGPLSYQFRPGTALGDGYASVKSVVASESGGTETKKNEVVDTQVSPAGEKPANVMPITSGVYLEVWAPVAYQDGGQFKVEKRRIGGRVRIREIAPGGTVRDATYTVAPDAGFLMSARKGAAYVVWPVDPYDQPIGPSQTVTYNGLGANGPAPIQLTVEQ